MLATMVGSANGRSMSALTTRLPGNASRTRTHAMRVPITELSTATTAETRSVTPRAARATGAVTASQNPVSPSSNERTVSAASGSSTMTLSHRPTTPRPRARPGTAVGRRPSRVGGVPAGCPGGGAGSVDESPRGRVVVVIGPPSLGRRVVDLGDRADVLGEQRAVDRLPATEVVDGPELLRLREVGGELLGDRGVDRAEPGLGPQPLRLGRVEEVVERLGLLGVLALAHHG